MASVTYQLHLVAPNAAASAPDLSSVGVGDSFDLVLTARDSRTPADSSPGVYAAYVDVGYDSAKANIAENGFVYATNFFNGQSGTPTTNLIDDLGSFYSGVFSVPPARAILKLCG